MNLQNGRNDTQREREIIEYSAAANGKRPINIPIFNLHTIFATEQRVS